MVSDAFLRRLRPAVADDDPDAAAGFLRAVEAPELEGLVQWASRLNTALTAELSRRADRANEPVGGTAP